MKAIAIREHGGTEVLKYTDLPDPEVVSCVLRAFYDITFQAPEGGIVTVVYPIMLEPG